MQLDVTSNKSVNDAISSILFRSKRIDLVVNNAGHALVGALEDSSMDPYNIRKRRLQLLVIWDSSIERDLWYNIRFVTEEKQPKPIWPKRVQNLFDVNTKESKQL